MAVHARRRLFIILVCALALAAVAPTSESVAAEPGPEWITPHDGDTVPYLNDLTFQVRAIPGADQYLYGFFENGKAVWENYANERHLDGTTYVLHRGSPGHRALGSGAGGNVSWSLQLWVRGYINDGQGHYHWSEASIINVRLVGFGCIIGPGGSCTY